MTQTEFNSELLEVIKNLTEKVQILQDQVNKHERTIANLLGK